MLNPESVDYNRGRVCLLFTDENAESNVKIYLSEDDAWRLHQMIQDTCNWKAKEKRSSSNEKYDATF